MQNILIVDNLNSLYQLFHVKERDIFWRFTSDLRALIVEPHLQIHKVILACDYGKSAYRMGLYPEYKQKRHDDRKKEDLRDAAARHKFLTEDVKNFTERAPKLGMEVAKLYGIEADDIIAYFVNHIDLTKYRIAVMSSDTDLFQLLRPNVKQRSYTQKMKFKPFDIRVPAKTWVTTKLFHDTYDMTPQEYCLYKCIAGDTGDNIPSPDQVGDSTAIKLVQKYRTFDNIWKNIDDLDIPRFSKKGKENLKKDFDLLYRNYELINLNHSPEVFDKIFAAKDKAVLDDIINRLDEPPQLDDKFIKDLMFASGRVKLYDSFETWTLPFRGKIH